MLPYLNETRENSKKYIIGFNGLNYGEGWADGEFSDSRNISTALHPCVTQRFARKVEGTFTSPSAMYAKDCLLVIDGTDVKVNGETVGTVTEGRKQLSTIGNYIVIFPDKVYYNVVTKEMERMEEWITSTGTTFTDSTITITGGTFKFRTGDAVTITGCSTEANNKTVIIRGVEDKKLTFYDNTFTAVTEAGAVTIKREIPDLDFICESGYRLWGTKGNTIYGSKWGDPLNFQVFDGISSDSYYIDVGSDGEFTGCIPYSSHICFFKENTLHKLYGSKPSNYQVVTAQIYGVQNGSERSMCVINETLFYKGVLGVYAYTGGVPELITDKFGTKRFSDACAATDGSRYYICMKSGDEWGVYVFDVSRNIWVQEDDLHCVDMATHEGFVHLLAADGNLYKVDGTGTQDDIEWSVTFCPFNETMNERKGYSKFHMRLALDAGAWLTAEIRRDNDTKWEQIYTTHNDKARTVSIPVLPQRSDSVEIRLSGKGKCTLRTFIREFFVGSDV